MRKLKWQNAELLPDRWKLSINSYGINRAFLGGLESGRFHCFSGPKASGKTTQAFYGIAAAQAMGKTCAYIDAEKTFEPPYARKCGIDVPSLKYIEANIAEEICDLIVPEMDKGLVDLIVIDSLSTINMESFYADPTANPMGISARSAGFVLDKLLNSLQRDQMVILISHVSMQKSGMHFVMAAKSSNKQDHIVSNTIMFTARNGESNLREDNYRKVGWKILKSKQPVINDKGEYYFRGPTAEIDQIDELIDVAKELDIIQGTTWLSFDDQKWQGKAKLAQALQADPALRFTIAGCVAGLDSLAITRTVDEADEEITKELT